MKFPPAASNRMELISPVKVQRIVKFTCPFASRKQWPDIAAINDPILWSRRPGKSRQRGEYVDCHYRRSGNTARGNLSRPACNKGLPLTTFKCSPLASTQRPRRSAVIAVFYPRPVIRSEDHERVFVEPVSFQSVEHLSDRPVDFFNYITVEPPR